MDTPGLNDVQMPITIWLERYNNAMKENSSVSLVVLVVYAKTRPDTCDKMNAAILDECFKAIRPKNFVVIFNKATKRFNEQKAIKWFEDCASGAGVTFPTLTDDQICIVRD